MEEEKMMGKSQESLNYESEGDIQTFYRWDESYSKIEEKLWVPRCIFNF